MQDALAIPDICRIGIWDSGNGEGLGINTGAKLFFLTKLPQP
jgi:hypothetical protein